MEKSSCLHKNYRFLDCDECEDCEIQICIECGMDITEADFIEKEKEDKQ